MTRNPTTLQAREPLSVLPDVFERGEVAMVVDGDAFVGIITRVDLINHLRLTAQ